MDKINRRMSEGNRVTDKATKKLDRLKQRLEDVKEKRNDRKKAFNHSKTTDFTNNYNREFSPGEIKLLEELTDKNKKDQTMTAEKSKMCDRDWHELNQEELVAVKAMGYNKHTWDNDKKIAVDDKCWSELNDQQKWAAKLMG